MIEIKVKIEKLSNGKIRGSFDHEGLYLHDANDVEKWEAEAKLFLRTFYGLSTKEIVFDYDPE